ncbi:MopA [Desulforapulum autotrophicum HRM2]|uniref:MopA n=1 Tax=Desulforapulum autotrophicum (strain ATCC 43914 / DSM 3382 / VKM B-1955 / HRM2) TaxID=177437 RepID=C0Q9R1_DESAH|nr:4Fe-4S dicluster domain-containing protein [Desulforapulum autotrophicum]ACN14625.1 MopA [Desulforapulum autotrophicum HRM2]
MDRRTFLKTAGIGSISVAYGCKSDYDKNIFSLVTAPEDFITGQAVWYATTCTECPAGCGILAKNREGRVIKLEGNPAHPVNQGKLCIRGQAALQSVYDPDRLLTPQLKTGQTFKPISFDQAVDILKQRMQAASERGNNRVKLLTGITSDPLCALLSTTLEAFGAGPAAVYEPFAHDALRKAHEAIFSKPMLPSFHMEKADFILGFGADFIETWLSPVEYIRKFKSMHSLDNGSKGMFVHAGPYMSLTAANADKFIPITAGTEYMVALGLIRQILETRTPDHQSDQRLAHLPAPFVKELAAVVKTYKADIVQEYTGFPAADQKHLAESLLASHSPLVLGSTGTTADTSFALEMAVTLLNLLLDKDLSLYDFEQRHALEKVMTAKQTADLFKTAVTDPTDLFLFYNTNPLFTFPENTDLTEIFNRKEIFKVSFSNFMDETSQNADLVFPVQLSLETWDSYESNTACISTLQPAMGRLTQAPCLGDVFLDLSDGERKFEDYYQYLADYLYTNMAEKSKAAFIETIQAGGIFHSSSKSGAGRPPLDPGSIQALKRALDSIEPSEAPELKFLAVPSIRLYDGRGANKSWLNEIPDPVTSIAWETMVMIHPATLEGHGFAHGDILTIESGDHAITAPVYSYQGVAPGVMVMQTGQGHKAYGRYAAGFGSSPIDLLSGSLETSDFLAYLITPSSVKQTGRVEALPQTDGSRSQYKRKIALSMTVGNSHGESAGHGASDGHGESDGHGGKAGGGLDMNQFPLTLPTKEGYDKKRDVYAAHDHVGYRWGMIVDLDKCVGCGSCVAACYAENNIGVVGKEQIINGREMAWLRIERYQDQNIEDRLIFLPMMCQHCDDAPCESVCPVYAPHHSKEGLNNQVYNRCIGTRFCAQNCPYKVRKFNWFDWERPKPLNLQLNPDVTVRSKGIMEKCSFCIQRIKKAHDHAKNENREIRDGEIQPACVQTCPAGALTFGNFLDKNSAVSRLARDLRAYQVLGYLNTKPAVIYLKKVVQEL